MTGLYCLFVVNGLLDWADWDDWNIESHRQISQWIVCNIPGSELKEGRLDYDRIPSRVYLNFREPRYFSFTEIIDIDDIGRNGNKVGISPECGGQGNRGSFDLCKFHYHLVYSYHNNTAF